MGAFGRFLKSVSTRWEPIMSGVAATFLLWLIGILYESKYGTSLPWYWYVLVACFFVFLACYFTWIEQARRLTREIDNNQTARQMISALNIALQTQLNDILHNLVLGSQSPFPPPEKLSYLNRYRRDLQRQLQYATPEEQVILTKKLALLEKQRMDFTPEQRPSHKYREQFYDVVKSIEELNAQLEKMRQDNLKKESE